MYKTGDTAKWMPDGTIEYLGRMDHQVKIRGFRIELGEIEAKILQHSAVKEAVVKALDDTSGMKYLCAYLSTDREIPLNELRAYLSGELPEYMIPSYFIFMELMPKNPNGKVDRAKLPEPSGRISDRMVPPEVYEGPESGAEQKLAGIWQDLLGHGKIGVQDNFFEIGGHSLKATMMMLRLRKEFNINISLNEVFKNPSIRGLACYIESLGNHAYKDIALVEGKENYAVSASQKRMYILNKIAPGGLEYNITFAIRITGHLDKDKMEKVFNMLVQRHESLRTSFDMVDGEPIQRICAHLPFYLEFLRCENEEELKYAVNHFARPFDLGKAPLIRAGLMERDEDHQVLVIDMHHIIIDGVSTEILFKEMIELYKGGVLPVNKVQYKDFSAWQNDYLKTENVKRQEKYWLDVLSGELPVLDLPTDFQRPEVQSFEGNRFVFKTDRGLAAGLKKVAAENGATLYMVLLAAYNILLAKYSSQEDIVVGSPIAGRHHADVQDVIGMFVNTLVMRNQPRGHLKFSEFLRNVKANALNAYENQEYQFEELVEKVNVHRNPGRNPIFDTMFVLQSMDVKIVNFNGLEFETFEPECKISKFDLTLTTWEQDDALFLEFEYCVKLFKKSTIERFLEHYLNILQKLCEGRDPKIAQIQILSKEEERKILGDFNDTTAILSKHKSLLEVFRGQVMKTPDATALVFGDEKMTYGEFDKKSGQVARMLVKQGVT